MIAILPEFLPKLLGGFLVNLEIAAMSLLIGVLLGVPLVLLMLRARPVAVPAAAIVAVMRAAPTFVVMFFLLNVVPREFSVLGIEFHLSGLVFVVLAQAMYAIAYTADNGVVAARALRANHPATAVLFLPNLVRAFFVLVMASATAAAVGIPEAINATLHEAERMQFLGDRIALFVLVMLFFTAVLQSAFALITLLRHRLQHWLTQEKPMAPAALRPLPYPGDRRWVSATSQPGDCESGSRWVAGGNDDPHSSSSITADAGPGRPEARAATRTRSE